MEYKNGFTPFGNRTVSRSDISPDIVSGRAVYPLHNDTEYNARVAEYEAEGFHEETFPVAEEVVVPVPIIPEGTKSITENRSYDVSTFAVADVNVSGGGGASDFSIAEVTVVNNAATNIDIIAPFSTQHGSMGSQGVRKDTTKTYEVIVLNNSALLYFSTFGTEVSLSVTGSIELDGDVCLITGDGTITISQPRD